MNSKNIADIEQAHRAAHNVLRSVIANSGDAPDPVLTVLPDLPRKKNPAAVALGRLGGRKGGKARAAALTAEQRAAIARQGGLARAARKAAVSLP
jgi:hypothetical protein